MLDQLANDSAEKKVRLVLGSKRKEEGFVIVNVDATLLAHSSERERDKFRAALQHASRVQAALAWAAVYPRPVPKQGQNSLKYTGIVLLLHLQTSSVIVLVLL